MGGYGLHFLWQVLRPWLGLELQGAEHSITRSEAKRCSGSSGLGHGALQQLPGSFQKSGYTGCGCYCGIGSPQRIELVWDPLVQLRMTWRVRGTL